MTDGKVFGDITDNVTTLLQSSFAKIQISRICKTITIKSIGEPGSWKTITLLKLAEDMIDLTEPDLRQQIPVVFNLSSWARKPQSIEQ
jgi:hypothetical protein